jgi:hypothetical protein
LFEPFLNSSRPTSYSRQAGPGPGVLPYHPLRVPPLLATFSTRGCRSRVLVAGRGPLTHAPCHAYSFPASTWQHPLPPILLPLSFGSSHPSTLPPLPLSRARHRQAAPLPPILTELPSGFADVPSCSASPPCLLSRLNPPVFEFFPTAGPLLYRHAILHNHRRQPPFSIHNA